MGKNLETTQPREPFSARDAARVQIRRLELQFGQRRDLTEGERTMLYAEYLDALEGYDPTRVEAAVTGYIRKRGSTFFPKVSELLEAIDALPRPRGVYEPPRLEALEGPRCTPEEAEEIMGIVKRLGVKP
jgi:hypothetical protein